MGSLERAIRRALNPISTRATMLVQGAGARRAFRTMPRRSATYGSVLGSVTPRPGQRPVRRAERPPTRSGEVVVPDVVGLTLDEARSVLREIGLVPVGSDPHAVPLPAAGGPDGVVVDQRPYPGTVLAIGSPVMVWAERGPGSAGVREPRRPTPEPQAATGMVDEQTGEAIG